MRPDAEIPFEKYFARKPPSPDPVNNMLYVIVRFMFFG